MSSNNQLCNNHFRVEWGGNRVGFMEVSGLAMELDVVPFRDGSSPDNSVTLLPGLKHFSPIVLKRGIVKGDNEFFVWMNTVQSGQVDRRDVTIALLNARHEPVVVWRVRTRFRRSWSTRAAERARQRCGGGDVDFGTRAWPSSIFSSCYLLRFM